MTREEFTLFEQELKDKGYRRYKGYDVEDFYYCKSFGKGDNMHDEDRSNYQLLFEVYDFEKYADRHEMYRINPIRIAPVIIVSRIIDERLDFELHGSVKETNINQIETLAESFFAWVEKNIQI